ncbi:unnamed protein product [Xylocopa violacea]|uniref:PARP16 N-terminal domain-containing protein n=1 Tax=Xylocopa violacea TaxID=135666 RepID=A0ABP1NH86_XYLVO
MIANSFLIRYFINSFCTYTFSNFLYPIFFIFIFDSSMMDGASKKQSDQNDKEKEKENKENSLDYRISKESDIDMLYTARLDSTSPEDVEKKVQCLKHILEKDLRAADLKWSLFVAACNTYRYDTCLKPFPPMYIKNECKDIEALRRAIEVIPPLAVIFKVLSEPDVYNKYGTVIDLLHWVLVRLRDPYIKSIKKECKSLFGKGIYLSSELGVSLPYSPVGYGWGGSVLGSEMSCIALCELINHPDIKTGDSEDNARSMVADSVGGRVPNKYYLVTNSELVRVRYLLIYSQQVQGVRCTENKGLLSWFKQHKLLTFVLGYVVLLASVGLTHNKQVEKYYKLFVQKVGLE